jgi:nitrile hydratase
MAAPPSADSIALLDRFVAALVARGVVTEAEIQDRIARTDRASPEIGARMVARAWTDPDYRALMLRDGTAAAEAAGISMAGMPPLGVLEDTDRVHHLVVCTLCSCYPWSVLGLPPAWYKSAAYRAKAVIDPRGVLADFGVSLPAGVEIRVWDSTAEIRYLVVPERPAGTEGWEEERLAGLVTRDSMIGTGLALPREEAGR